MGDTCPISPFSTNKTNYTIHSNHANSTKLPNNNFVKYFVALAGIFGITSIGTLLGGGNEIFSAGFGLLFITSFLSGAKQAILWLWSSLWERLAYSIDIPERDPCFNYLMAWVSTRPEMQNSHCCTLKTVQKDKNNKDDDSDDEDKPNILWMPSIGVHVLNYHGKFVTFSRNSDKPSISSKKNARGQEELSINKGETISFTYYGFDEQVLHDLVLEAVEMAMKKTVNRTKIHAMDQWNENWELATVKDKRSLDSLVLDSSVISVLDSDLSFFLRSKEWFAKRGIPYRRGYLLHGPPGTGKTSTILALAGKYNSDLCYLNLNAKMDDAKLMNLFHTLPKNAFVVLEDVDAMFVKRKKSEDSQENSISFSGLLNALDGIASVEGRILFMTTNHIERLSPALIRPGRVDRKVKLDYATHAQVEKMLYRFYDDEPALYDIAEKLLEKIGDLKITPAQLQGFFIYHADKAQTLLDDVDAFLKEVIEENNRTDEEEKDKDEAKEQEDKDKKGD